MVAESRDNVGTDKQSFNSDPEQEVRNKKMRKYEIVIFLVANKTKYILVFMNLR